MAGLLSNEVNQEFAAAPGSSDGTLTGRNTTTPIGFAGTTPIVRPTLSIGTATTAQIVTALGALGLVTTTA